MAQRHMAYLLLGVVLVPVAWLVWRSASAQRPDNLGVKNGRLADCPASPNCVCTQATDASHRIAPIPFADEPSAALERIQAALRLMPRTTIVSEAPRYLHAECTSRLFRFVDDVEFYIDAEARLIHVRSASRTGYSDLGVNRARVEALRDQLQPGEPGA